MTLFLRGNIVQGRPAKRSLPGLREMIDACSNIYASAMLLLKKLSSEFWSPAGQNLSGKCEKIFYIYIYIKFSLGSVIERVLCMTIPLLKGTDSSTLR